jgi:very-short-patch-repair endonuclease
MIFHGIDKDTPVAREHDGRGKAAWTVLRSRKLAQYKFRRQHPLGPFILDFACLEHRLVVEADGGQHAESEADARRTASLAEQEWRVVRFWNNDILSNTVGVVEMIVQELKARPRFFVRAAHPHPPIASRWAPPSPTSGRGENG